MNLIQTFRLFLFVLIASGLGLIFTRALWVPKMVDNILAYTGQAQVVSYVCDGGLFIDVNYYEGPVVMSGLGNVPVPTGVVSLRLSDGRSMSLAQTISADGVRYSNPDESFVFWSKGNGALVLEDGREKAYTGCIGK